MVSSVQVKRRSSTGAVGAPSTLKSGEIAYNMADGYFYIGYGDDGAGIATSVKSLAKDDFSINHRVPAGGSAGYILTKTSASDYAFTWQPAPANYTIGNALTLTGNTVAVDFTKVAPLSSPAFTGTPTAPTAAAGTNSTALATTAFVTNGLAGKANSVHTHDAADITSGVLDIARIPVLPSDKAVVSSGGIADLTSAQQSNIASGTIVTTTDGRRFVYSGSGTKTDEGSYVVLADITPEWSSVANKPNFATVATSGAYSDLSGRPTLSTVASTGSYTDLLNRPTLATVATSGNYSDLSGKPTLATVATSGSYNDLISRPTLGTLASQNANAVNITGGSLDSVTITNSVIDGGTF